MPAISFSTLKDKVLSGEKKQTIRAKRSDYWLQYEEGDYFVGYWKMRSEGASEKLFESQLSEEPFVISNKDFDQELAKRDGFTDDENFRAIDYMESWFVDQYTDEFIDGMEFVVLRWD